MHTALSRDRQRSVPKLREFVGAVISLSVLKILNKSLPLITAYVVVLWKNKKKRLSSRFGLLQVGEEETLQEGRRQRK